MKFAIIGTLTALLFSSAYKSRDQTHYQHKQHIDLQQNLQKQISNLQNDIKINQQQNIMKQNQQQQSQIQRAKQQTGLQQQISQLQIEKIVLDSIKSFAHNVQDQVLVQDIIQGIDESVQNNSDYGQRISLGDLENNGKFLKEGNQYLINLHHNKKKPFKNDSKQKIQIQSKDWKKKLQKIKHPKLSSQKLQKAYEKWQQKQKIPKNLFINTNPYKIKSKNKTYQRAGLNGESLNVREQKYTKKYSKASHGHKPKNKHTSTS